MDSYTKWMQEKKARRYAPETRRIVIVMLVIAVIGMVITVVRERVPCLQSKEGYRLQTCLLVDIQPTSGARDSSYTSVFQTESGDHCSIPTSTWDHKGRRLQLYVSRSLDAFRAEYELPRGPIGWYLCTLMFLFILVEQILYWIGWLKYRHEQASA